MFKSIRNTLRGILEPGSIQPEEPEIRNGLKGGLSSLDTQSVDLESRFQPDAGSFEKINESPPIYIDADDDNEDQEKRGQQEALKETVKNEEINKEKFENMVSNSDCELFRLTSKSPFEIFPKQVIIDINKINIVTKPFVLSEQIHSIFIQDIKDIKVTTSPMTAALEIMDNNPDKTIIGKLDKKEAIKARKIIQGLIVAKKQQIDLSKLNNVVDLAEKLEKLGATQEADK